MNFPSKLHEHLNVLAGIWDTTITLLNKDGSDGKVSHASDNCIEYRRQANL